jgi:hypothetical protein
MENEKGKRIQIQNSDLEIRDQCPDKKISCPPGKLSELLSQISGYSLAPSICA